MKERWLIMNKNSQSLQIKKEILVNLVKAFYSDDFCKNTALIPFKMRPKNAEVPFRCCIYKEREIIKDRIIAYLGYAIEPLDETEKLEDFAKMSLEREEVTDKRHLTVIDTACKGCVPSRVYVTDLCQGCVSRACEKVCNFGAVSIEGGCIAGNSTVSDPKIAARLIKNLLDKSSDIEE